MPLGHDRRGSVAPAAWLLPSDVESRRVRPFDLFGFLLVSPGLVALLYGLEQAAHGHGWVPLGAGVLLVAAFLAHAHRAQTSALIDLSLFRSCLFANAAMTLFLLNGMLYAAQFLIPLYLISGEGLTPEKAAWLLAPPSVAMVFVYPFMGTITDRFGCRAVVTSGVLLALLGSLPFVWMAQRGFTTAGVELGLPSGLRVPMRRHQSRACPTARGVLRASSGLRAQCPSLRGNLRG